MSSILNAAEKLTGKLFKRRPKEQQRLRHWNTSNRMAAVGVYYHRDACKAFAGIDEGYALTFFAAQLTPENNNPHDENAVAIYCEGHKLGHLSRDHAMAYRGVVGDEVTVCDAVLSGGGIVREKQMEYDIQLCLDFEISPSRRTTPLHAGAKFRCEPLFASQLGRGVFIGPVDSETARHCSPGMSMSTWIKDGVDAVHFFAPGTHTGQGQAGVVSFSSLRDAGLDPERLTCVIKDVGNYFVIVELSPSAQDG